MNKLNLLPARSAYSHYRVHQEGGYSVVRGLSTGALPRDGGAIVPFLEFTIDGSVRKLFPQFRFQWKTSELTRSRWVIRSRESQRNRWP